MTDGRARAGRWRTTPSDRAWLAGQVVVFAVAFVVLPWLDGGPGRLAVGDWPRPVGYAVAAAGAGLAVWAMATLGPQLVPQPTPVAGGEVVATGPYRIVRHPIYLGVLLLAAGSLLRVPSVTGIVATVATAVFLDRKAAHEERLLVAAHPERYAALRRTVRWRVVPGIPARP